MGENIDKEEIEKMWKNVQKCAICRRNRLLKTKRDYKGIMKRVCGNCYAAMQG
jgi:hypothetical protein